MGGKKEEKEKPCDFALVIKSTVVGPYMIIENNEKKNEREKKHSLPKILKMFHSTPRSPIKISSSNSVINLYFQFSNKVFRLNYVIGVESPIYD